MASRKPTVLPVANLGDKAPYPYTSITRSPFGRLILVAGKDTVRFISIKPSGLKEVKSVRIAQFFQETRSVGLATSLSHQNNNSSSINSNNNNSSNAPKRLQLNEVFGSAQRAASANTIITITDVAWSFRQHNNNEHSHKSSNIRNIINDYPDTPTSISIDGQNNESQTGNDMKRDPFSTIISMPDDLRMADDSLIAVAASNGVVVVWRTSNLLGGGFGNNNGSRGNNFAGNNVDHFQFLQQYVNHQGDSGTRRSNANASASAIGQPEAILVEHNRAVNCIAWHKHKPGVFLTASQDGTVKMFERREIKTNIDKNSNNKNGVAVESKWKWFSKSNASSSVKSYSWHYTGCFKPNCGPVRDIQWSNFDNDLFAMVTNNGFLVVHNINLLNNARPMVRVAAHAREATCVDWHPVEKYIIATGSVDKTVKVWDLESEIAFHVDDHMNIVKQNSNSIRSHGSIDSGSYASGDSSAISTYDNDNLNSSHHGVGNYSSFGASSTLSSANFSSAPSLLKPRSAKTAAFTQIHELSVSAQVEKLHWRPPKVSNFDKHISYAQNDHHVAMLAIATAPASGAASGGHGTLSLWSCHRPYMPLSIVDGHEDGAVIDFIWLDTPEIDEDQDEGIFLPGHEDNKSSLTGTWQHALSIGRDGRCIVQSFAKGDRPLSNVAPSAFAITNLSPFQHGFGSLQIISAHQRVPAGQNNDYLLCGLRQDEYTSLAPGFYMEDLPPPEVYSNNTFQCSPKYKLRSDSNEIINLSFHVTDCGALNDLFSSVRDDNLTPDEVKIAPEVVHISRFAEGYKICTDECLPTKATVCRFNAAVAATLKYKGHTKMWNILSSILEGIELERSTMQMKKSMGLSEDAMSFILHPTLKSLLLERADAGDVQTCVILCEVLEVIVKQKNGTVLVTIPGLDILLVRQWYLSYIEILQQMCLFSHAADLIRNCKDPEIGKLNQTSTTIHEACPMCAKPLHTGQKSCGTCRRKVGLCFLCHESVTGMFVMCPGCGHGGHLEHAIEWFTCLDNKFNQLCPTGCGHKCNLISLPKGSTFPRTESLHHL